MNIRIFVDTQPNAMIDAADLDLLIPETFYIDGKSVKAAVRHEYYPNDTIAHNPLPPSALVRVLTFSSSPILI